MSAGLHVEWFIYLGIGVLGVIALALVLKSHVKASVWWRSAGFLLEADDHSGPFRDRENP